MARSPFSKAIHRSIQRQLRQYKAEGTVGKTKPTNLDEAVQLAAQNAYTRVRTDPGPGDTPPRSK